ncbi:hypothetical protein P9D28_18040 [Bacillus haynesii]|nr:hypothetical protein [Bacillus haynesii]MEC1554314.1 hypothetical protein [Bacillus haynesii]
MDDELANEDVYEANAEAISFSQYDFYAHAVKSDNATAKKNNPV